MLPSHLATQQTVQYTMTSSCDLSHDYSSMSLFSSLVSFLSYPILHPNSGPTSFMLTCITGFPFSRSPFCSSYSWGLFCLSCLFLLHFLCHVHWARLPRQCSDQSEIRVAYVVFLMLCLYKKMGLRRDGTRKSRTAMTQSDPDANSLDHGHSIFLICTILLSPVGN